MGFPTSLRRPATAALAALALDGPVRSAAHAAATVNKGDTTWMLVATCFVVLMTIPGLALFYGGLVRAKNILSVLMQVLVIFCIISILWVIYGYSLAFTGNAAASLNPFIGGFSKFFLAGVTTTFGAGNLLEGNQHSGTGLRHLPDDLRLHHAGPHRRRLRRAHEVLGRAALHGDLVHLRLPAHGPHGVVLGRSGRLHAVA